MDHSLPSPIRAAVWARHLQGGDEEAVVAVKQGRKQAARSKVLRSQAILQAAHNAKPAGKMVGRKPKGSVLAQQQKEQQAGQQQRLQVQQQRDGGKAPGGGRKGKKAGAAVAASFDLWEDPEDTRDGWTDSMLPAKRPRRGPAPASQLRQPGEASTALVRVKGAKEARSEAQRPAVAAVEIDPAGCSYNPDRGQHQEAVAAAVAVETKKMLDRVRACSDVLHACLHRVYCLLRCCRGPDCLLRCFTSLLCRAHHTMLPPASLPACLSAWPPLPAGAATGGATPCG